MNIDNISVLVRALLKTASETANSDGLTITVLTKFVYLTDVYFARRHEGNTFTGLEWKFLHFGPYSYAFQESLKNKQIKNVSIEEGESQAENPFTLVKPVESASLEAMEDTNLGIGITSVIERNVKSYSRNLNSLLQYVYFDTEPMDNATPGEVLRFQNCIPLLHREYKPLGKKNITPEKREKTKKLLQSLRAKREAQKSKLDDYYPPKYDDHYLGVIDISESTEDSSSRHRAKLTFEE